MKRHINGYIVEGIDIIDVNLWRRRLKENRLSCEKWKAILINRLEDLRQELKVKEGDNENS